MNLSDRVIKSKEAQSKGKLSLSDFYVDKDRGDSESEDILNENINEYKQKLNEVKERILEEARLNAKEIEKSAYIEGYDQGKKNGYEDGYREAYTEYVDKAKEEALKIKKEADELLFRSNREFVAYLKEKNKDVINLAINIASSVLRKKFDDKESMSELLKNIISEYEQDSTFIVKCNSYYEEDIREDLNSWKKELPLGRNIFVVADDSLEKGNAVIERENGRVILGIDCAISKLKEELLGGNA
ncbi:FliH/SctL family protein [Metaclostridioides mangenotii]|uniref:Flagellar assembly protein FliH n=1 Tax=Metaclostridioides mangenotii TaxID=1540 RepID=A0ABS4ECM6_9FIRM|nr:flagellar assembly protein FliH [Clostridioides mangenotii]MBP1855651.1 flagellar assembly protein FliH [Clostridioides mangenotii]